MPTIKKKKEDYASLGDYQINTKKLKVGMKISYSELCKLIGAPVTQGNSKNAQLSDTLKKYSFKRYFDYEKIGRGLYEITEIYDEPLPISDGRQYGNNSVYAQYIELILMHYLANRRGHVERFSRHKLWLLLGMINNKYNRISNTTLSKKNKILTQFEINHFYQRCNKKLSIILRSALNNLKARRLIEWEEETIIQNKDGEWFIGTDLDVEEILEAERETLKKYGYTKIFQVYSAFKQKQYYDDVIDLLNKRFEWNGFYRRIKIIYNKENIIDAIPETEVNLQKKLLNDEVSKYLNNQAKHLYDKSMDKYNQKLSEEYDKLETIYSYNEFHLPDTYMAAQELLVDELIKIGNKKDQVSLDQMIDLSTSEAIDSLFPML